MKRIGFLLIAAGFLGGAYLAVLDTKDVKWEWFAVPIAVGVIGIVLVRTAIRGKALKEGRISHNISLIEKSVGNLVNLLSELNREKEALNTYDVAQKLDDLLLDDLNAFVESRESIVHVYGLQAYADIMSHFAGGERYLHRVWSASIDGYVNEVNEYLDRALEQFTMVQQRMTEARTQIPV